MVLLFFSTLCLFTNMLFISDIMMYNFLLIWAFMRPKMSTQSINNDITHFNDFWQISKCILIVAITFFLIVVWFCSYNILPFTNSYWWSKILIDFIGSYCCRLKLQYFFHANIYFYRQIVTTSIININLALYWTISSKYFKEKITYFEKTWIPRYTVYIKLNETMFKLSTI